MAGIGPLHVAFVLAMLLGIGGLLVALSAMRRRDALRARFELVLEGHRIASTSASAEPPLRDRLLASRWIQRGMAVLGLRLDLVAEYRPRWFFVLGGCFVASRIAAGIVADILGDALLLPCLLGFWILGCRGIFGTLHSIRRDRLFRQFPDVLGQITRSVRVGIPVVEAVRMVAAEAPEPTAKAFAAISDRLTVGVPIDEALAETAHRTGLPEYRFFATALSLQSRTGGGIAETLDNLSEVIRKRVALRQRGYALAAEARTSAAILAALPVVTGGLLLVVNPSYAMVLFTTSDGKTALGLAVGMMLMGMGVMRVIIKKSLS